MSNNRFYQEIGKVVSLFAICGFLGCTNDRVNLTSEEKEWLKTHGDSIVLEYDATFAPVEFELNGEYQGIAADVIAEIENILSITILSKSSKDWNQSVERLKTGETELLGAMVKNPERETFALFSDSYFTMTGAFFAKKGMAPFTNLSALEGKRIAVVNGYIQQAYLIANTDTTKVHLVPVVGMTDGIVQVMAGEVDYFAGSIAATSWKIMTMGVTNLTITGEIPSPLNLSIAVSKKNPILHSILNKALRAIPQSKFNEIKQTWVVFGGKRQISPVLVWSIVSILGIIIVILLVRQYRIRRDSELVVIRFGKQLAEISAQIPDTMMYQVKISHSGERTFLFVSDGIVPLHGLTSEQLLADPMSLYGQFHSDDIGRLIETENTALASMSVFRCEARYHHPDGSLRWSLLTSTPRKTADGSVIWDGIDMDITRFKLLERDLEMSRRFTVQAIDSSHQLFGWLSTDGTLLFANATSLAMIDAQIDDVVGKKFWDTPWFNHNSEEQEKLKVAIAEAASGSSLRYEVTHECSNSKIREIDFFISPILETTGEVSMLVVEGVDITDERFNIRQKEKLQEQLHQSQKMEAVGQLAGGIAHDFNNALAGIIGAAEMIKTGEMSPDEEKEYIDLILVAGDRAADLTKKLLTFSRKGTKASSAVDCTKIVADTVALLRHTINKNIALSVKNRAIQTSVIGDDSLLQNAIMNIAINASHAMPNGGEIELSLENIELDAEYCEVSPFEIKPGEYLEISIRDNGTGMPPEILSRIFEPFFTTKQTGHGTGLGLAAVYGAVQEHDGAITVYSEEGTGTIFRIYLPVTNESVRREIESEPSISGSGTVLVIDDEELIRITASALLRSLGYRVICATNGLEGVEIFAEIHEEIDLIILDMIMPVMGGREAFVKLREINPSIPIVIASGFSKEDDITELKKQGVNGFLNKPFRKAALAEMIVQHQTPNISHENKNKDTV